MFVNAKSHKGPMQQLRVPFEYVSSSGPVPHVLHAFEESEKPGASAQVITEVTPPFRITHTNVAWTELTGFSREECIGATTAIVHGGTACPLLSRCLEAAVHGGHSCVAKLTNRHQSGTPYECLLSLAPLTDETGRVAHYLGTLHPLAAPSGIMPPEVKWAACRLAAEVSFHFLFYPLTS